jgi:hypothetical protein
MLRTMNNNSHDQLREVSWKQPSLGYQYFSELLYYLLLLLFFVCYSYHYFQVELGYMTRYLPLPGINRRFMPPASLSSRGHSSIALQKSEFYHFISKSKFDPPLSISEIERIKPKQKNKKNKKSKRKRKQKTNNKQQNHK